MVRKRQNRARRRKVLPESPVHVILNDHEQSETDITDPEQNASSAANGCVPTSNCVAGDAAPSKHIHGLQMSKINTSSLADELIIKDEALDITDNCQTFNVALNSSQVSSKKSNISNNEFTNIKSEICDVNCSNSLVIIPEVDMQQQKCDSNTQSSYSQPDPLAITNLARLLPCQNGLEHQTGQEDNCSNKPSSVIDQSLLNNFKIKGRDLLKMVEAVTLKLDDISTSTVIKSVMITALKNVVTSFLFEFKQLYEKEYFIEFIIKLYRDILKFKFKIPSSRLNFFINPILGYILSVVDGSITVNDKVIESYRSQIMAIAQVSSIPPSSGSIEDTNNTISHLEECNANDISPALKSINSSFSFFYPSLFESSNVKPSTSSSDLPDIKPVVVDTSTDEGTSLSQWSDGSGVDVDSGVAPVDGDCKVCSVDGCVSSFHACDTHETCVIHSSCTQSLVFDPCSMCHNLYKKLHICSTRWKTVFTQRFDQFRWYRKLSGLQTDLMYVSTIVERQFEIFDTRITFDSRTLAERLRESFKKQDEIDAISEKQSAETHDPLSSLIMHCDALKRETSLGKSSDESNNEVDTANDDDCVTVQQGYKRKRSKLQLDSESANKRVSCDAEERAGVVLCGELMPPTTTTQQQLHSASNSNSSDESSSQSSFNSSNTAVSTGDGSLTDLLLQDPETWFVAIRKAHEMPRPTVLSKIEWFSAKELLTKCVLSLQEGDLSGALLHATSLRECCRYWEPAHMLLITVLLQLGLRRQAKEACGAAIALLKTAPGLTTLLARLNLQMALAAVREEPAAPEGDSLANGHGSTLPMPSCWGAPQQPPPASMHQYFDLRNAHALVNLRSSPKSDDQESPISQESMDAFLSKASVIIKNTTDLHTREQLLRDLTMVYVSDDKLLNVGVRQMNKIVQGLPQYLVRVLKHRRRTLKNRGYAHSCRLKRKTVSETLEMQCANLRKALKAVIAENQYLRNTTKTFRRGCKELLGKVMENEPDYIVEPELVRLVTHADPPPALMPAVPYSHTNEDDAPDDDTAWSE